MHFDACPSLPIGYLVDRADEDSIGLGQMLRQRWRLHAFPERRRCAGKQRYERQR